MQNEKRTRIVVLLHQVLALIHPAQFKFVEQQVLHCSILDETGKNEMRCQTFCY